jgi:hypothetical protein
MPSFLGRVIDPLVGSKSPASIFIKVVLPAPLGPVIAYRRPAIKLQVTSSNKILPPNRIVMLLTESIALNYTVKSLGVLGGVQHCKLPFDMGVDRELPEGRVFSLLLGR